MSDLYRRFDDYLDGVHSDCDHSMAAKHAKNKGKFQYLTLKGDLL